RLAKRLGARSSLDETLADRFRLEARDGNKVRRAARDLAEQVVVLFDTHRASKLELAGGRLVVTFPDTDARPSNVATLLQEVEIAARTVDRVELNVTTLGGSRHAL